MLEALLVTFEPLDAPQLQDTAEADLSWAAYWWDIVAAHFPVASDVLQTLADSHPSDLECQVGAGVDASEISGMASGAVNAVNVADAATAGRHLQELQRLSAFQQVTTKVPPAYDGRSSWFAYEDAIDDWVDITELEPEKQGPALRNRLEGEAAIHKRLLDRDRLKDRVNGVRYFKSYLRLQAPSQPA